MCQAHSSLGHILLDLEVAWAPVSWVPLSLTAASLGTWQAGQWHNVGSDLGLGHQLLCSHYRASTPRLKCVFLLRHVSKSLLGASPLQMRQVRGSSRGTCSEGWYSCFANTQEALPESFPRKVSARPIWCSTGRESQMVFCVLFFVRGLSAAEAHREREEHRLCSWTHCGFKFQSCCLSRFVFSESRFSHQ